MTSDNEKSECRCKHWFEWSLAVVLIVNLVAFVVIRYCGINYEIKSHSMADTLLYRDCVFANIFNKEYNRGDIVVYKKGDISIIRRIIALPGEKVEIKKEADGSFSLYINDEKYDEPYVKNKHENEECFAIEPDTVCKSLVVPEGKYYVLADNRGSRAAVGGNGLINMSAVKGKIVFIYFPERRIRKLP